MKIKAVVETKKGNVFEVMLPATRVVCYACDGSGTELRGGLKGAVLDEESLHDEEFMERYMGGDYDTHCSECKGANVLVVVDEDALTPKMLDRYNRHLDSESKYRAEVEAERRAGC